MSSARVSVEWIFGDVFKLLNFRKNLKIKLRSVGKMHIVCALLHNARSCFMEHRRKIILDYKHH